MDSGEGERLPAGGGQRVREPGLGETFEGGLRQRFTAQRRQRNKMPISTSLKKLRDTLDRARNRLHRGAALAGCCGIHDKKRQGASTHAHVYATSRNQSPRRLPE